MGRWRNIRRIEDIQSGNVIEHLVEILNQSLLLLPVKRETSEYSHFADILYGNGQKSFARSRRSGRCDAVWIVKITKP